MSQKRLLNADDLYLLKSVTDPQISPNGKECVFVQTSMLKEKNDYSSNLYYVNLEDDSQVIQWTFGDTRSHSPRWSPDQSKIVFMSNRSGKNQLYVLNRNGGEAKQITFFKNGAGNPVWSPNGKKLAFSVSLGENESLTDKETDEGSPEKLVPLEVERMKYKSDSEGFLKWKYKQIAIVDLDTGNLEQITEGATDHFLQSWSPDGEWIAVTADESGDLDQSFCLDVFLINTSSKERKKITNGTGYFGNVSWSPNSRFLGFTGHEREYENATLSRLWVYDFQSDHFTCLTGEMDMMVGDLAIGDFQQGAATPGIIWCADNESFYFLATDNGNTVVYFGNLSGEIYPALLDNQHIYGLSIESQGERAIVALSRPTFPGELFELHVPTGEMRQLTDVNKEVLGELTLSDPEPFSFTATDGLEVKGWLMKPAQYEEGKQYPLIVEIHGGPHAMYANTYFHEFQLLAAQGFGVMYINPRGSHGYGQDFVNAVRGDYGGNDYQDIMDGLDHVLAHYHFIDKEKLGVTGGSYGGFMTNWIVGHTDRFKAAVTQRSISNWISFYGVSDIGYYFTEWQIQADLSDIQTLWKHSPLAYVEHINTPLLILHGEKDYRCPIEQAEQLFIALKRKGKETKFIRFPEANHELSRSGKPSLRISRLTYITDWFNQYLK